MNESGDKFFEMSPDLLCIASTEGYFIRLNPAWETTLGYPREELLGRPFSDFVHQDDIEATAEQIALQLAGQETLNFINRYRHKDGSWRWLEWRANATPDGKFLFAVARNVTESKLMRKRLDEQQALLAAITGSVKDSIIMLDGKGRINYWNEGAIALFGYEKAEVMGKNLHDMMTPEPYLSQHKLAFPAFQETGKGNAIDKTVELLAKHKDGREIPIDLSLTAFRVNNEWHSIGIVHDVTERNITDKELRRLHRAIEQSPVSIVITDLDGNIEYVNPKAEETTGYTLDELRGKNPRVLKSGETSDQEYKTLWDNITTGNQWRGIFHNKRKNGELYWESSNISPIINSYGKVISYLAVKEDITAQKKVRDDLVKSEAMLREANATKDKLFSIIAHDLRGPIGNFMPILDVLTSDEYELDETSRKRLMAEMKKTSSNTLALLENLLNWSKSQSEHFKLIPERINLLEILARNAELFKPVALHKSISIEIDVPETLTGYADPHSIDLVVRNLLSNALKFTNPGGKVRVEAAGTGGTVEVKISDTGVGMDPEFAGNLFKERTFRTTEGTAREKGTGLGLVLCQDFVERNGGHIRVESILNQGSSFIFTLPKYE